MAAWQTTSQSVLKTRPRKEAAKSKRCQSRAEAMPCQKSDSSTDNAIAEINESATMPQHDLAKVYSGAQNQEPMQPESVSTRPTAAEATNVDLPAINPTVEERASVVKESERAVQGRWIAMRCKHKRQQPFCYYFSSKPDAIEDKFDTL